MYCNLAAKNSVGPDTDSTPDKWWHGADQIKCKVAAATTLNCEYEYPTELFNSSIFTIFKESTYNLYYIVLIIQ